jgi:hypothetical protein
MRVHSAVSAYSQLAATAMPSPHVAERIDRDRLFVGKRELCHPGIFGPAASGGNVGLVAVAT